jgi:hypothetical protein
MKLTARTVGISQTDSGFNSNVMAISFQLSAAQAGPF